MIHFSLSPDDAKRVFRALILAQKIHSYLDGRNVESQNLKRVSRVVAGARKAGSVAESGIARHNIEENNTREGIELCAKIS